MAYYKQVAVLLHGLDNIEIIGSVSGEHLKIFDTTQDPICIPRSGVNKQIVELFMKILPNIHCLENNLTSDIMGVFKICVYLNIKNEYINVFTKYFEERLTFDQLVAFDLEYGTKRGAILFGTYYYRNFSQEIIPKINMMNVLKLLDIMETDHLHPAKCPTRHITEIIKLYYENNKNVVDDVLYQLLTILIKHKCPCRFELLNTQNRYSLQDLNTFPMIYIEMIRNQTDTNCFMFGDKHGTVKKMVICKHSLENANELVKMDEYYSQNGFEEIICKDFAMIRSISGGYMMLDAIKKYSKYYIIIPFSNERNFFSERYSLIIN